jgi:hypothetical protein
LEGKNMAKSSLSSSKTRRTTPVAGHDRLMSLPQELLNKIFARLLFEKLVRTSSLYRAWHRR